MYVFRSHLGFERASKYFHLAVVRPALPTQAFEASVTIKGKCETLNFHNNLHYYERLFRESNVAG